MPQTINFVTLPPNPEDPFIAPLNAEVILGVGDKGDDAARYGSLPQKVAEKRPDIDLITEPVSAISHSDAYNNLLGQYEDIKQTMLEKASGKNSALFHASDMRFLMDLASEDPRALDLLQDFVGGLKSKFKRLLSAIGIVPATVTENEEDQVEEPELEGPPEDEVRPEDAEIIYEETMKVIEGFKAQKAPKGKSVKGIFSEECGKGFLRPIEPI